jgi:serine/threonine-protein kinase RsbW
MSPLRKTIPSTTEHLKEVREFVSRAAAEVGFLEEDVNNIVLAVDEACTNVIRHAYHYAPDKEITIEVLPQRTMLVVRVLDEGQPFDPSAIRSPDLEEHLRQYRKGGLGMHMMKTFMDKVEYQFNPGKKNEVRLTKYLTQPPTRAVR